MNSFKIIAKLIFGLIFFISTLNPVFSKETSFKTGSFYLKSAHEVGSELLIKDDGSFEYFLSYGAYDEYSKGTWVFKDGNIILTSNVPDIPPKFTLKDVSKKNEGEYTVFVQDKNGNGIPAIDVVLYFKDRKVTQGYTQYYGYKFTALEQPQSIGLKIDMYGVKEQVFELKEQKGDYFVFEFDAGNLGFKNFNNTKFNFKDDTLTLIQEGIELHYIRQK